MQYVTMCSEMAPQCLYVYSGKFLGNAHLYSVSLVHLVHVYQCSDVFKARFLALARFVYIYTDDITRRFCTRIFNLLTL